MMIKHPNQPQTQKRFSSFFILSIIFTTVLVVFDSYVTKVSSFSPSSSKTQFLPKQLTKRQSAVEDDTEKKQDFSGDAAALFGNLRIPAALFAGASAGAAFSLPIAMTQEGLKVGLVKRIYALLMIASLSSQIVTVVVTTLAVAGITATKTMNAKNKNQPAESLGMWLKENYLLELTSVRWHFFSGVLMFIVGIGLRAWISIVCPVIAKIALGTVVTSTLICAAFLQDLYNQVDVYEEKSFLHLPFLYIRLLLKKAVPSNNQGLFSASVFTLSLLSFVTTLAYTLYKTPHILHYLMGS